MATLEIKQFGDPVLRKTAKKVQRVNNSVRKTLDDMLETMRVACGAGLAAPQVGISKRMAIVDIGEGPFFLVNPELVSVSQETQTGIEGCLSWPGYVGEVERPLRATVKALDRDGHDVWIEGEGYLARALLHEMDHLDGVLYIDRATTISEVKKEDPAEEQDAERPEADKIRAVFMGSPEFAVPSLDELVNAGVRIEFVVTQPDRPFGRKQELRPTPVKERATELGIPVIACERVSDPEVVSKVCESAVDFVVVAAFGQKLPASILTAPRIACLNVHPSLLPKYRGGNPVQRAVMNGEKVTGVSIICLSERMDAGDIVLQKTVEIGPDETFGTLEKRLASLGAHALIEAGALLAAGSTRRIRQDESEATYGRHLSKGEEIIDWSKTRSEIHNLTRGLSPRPGAVTYLDGERIKILETRVLTASGAQPSSVGGIIGTEDESAIVQCGDGSIAVLEVQPGGKKPMSAKAFLAGRRSTAVVFNGGERT